MHQCLTVKQLVWARNWKLFTELSKDNINPQTSETHSQQSGMWAFCHVNSHTSWHCVFITEREDGYVLLFIKIIFTYSETCIKEYHYCTFYVCNFIYWRVTKQIHNISYTTSYLDCHKHTEGCCLEITFSFFHTWIIRPQCKT